MGKTISVERGLADKVAAFIKAESLDCALLGPGDEAAIRVVQAEDREQCDSTTLCAGGWIFCEDAMAMAAALEVPRATIGKFFDHMDVKIRGCQLGCF